MVHQRCVNPFFHRIDLRPEHYIYIVLGTIFLFPIRIVLSLLLFIVTSLLARLYAFILSFIDRNEEPERYHRWRLVLKVHLVWLIRSILFICGFYSVTVCQKGDEEKERDAPIYIFAPHTSLFDILAGITFNAPSSVAKADIVDIPLFGNIFKLSDPVLVERDSKASRQDVFQKVTETIKYSKIVFFPEGTCSNHRMLLRFKNGAFKFGYPVIPVALRFNQHGGPDTLSWTWDGPSTLASIWLTLARWRTDLEITKLPVYYPSKEEQSNPDLYAENVTKVLVKELKIPCLFYSFDDVRYLKYKFFRSSSCVKFLKLCDKIRQMRSTITNLQSNDSFNSSSPHGDSATNDVNSNNLKTPNTVSSKTIGTTTLFAEFFSNYIDEVNEKLANYDLDFTLDQEMLVEVLHDHSTSGLINSYSVKEFMCCLEKLPSPGQLKHLKIILCLVDLRVKDLWERLRNCYEIIPKMDDGTISYDDLKTLLWLALNLEDVDNDQEVRNIKILSFDDLKSLIMNYYEFALRENANIISQNNTQCK